MAVSEHLVGRAEELDAVETCLGGLAGGAGCVLQLVGEPGIGKTRLLAELAARADGRGWLVLDGSASELETDLPYWVFVDALEEYVRGLDPSRLEPLGGETLAELGQVLPALARTQDGRGQPQQHQRYRAHRAIRALLERLALSGPLVLTLDDLHWADPASLELIAALLQRPPAGPVLLALAVRAQQVPESIAPLLERMRRTGALTRLELQGLTPDEAAELLHGDLATALSLYDLSGGNPFYLEELTRAGATAADSAPSSVVAALAEELRTLDERTRVLLQGAAVAGDPFETELAAAGAGIDEEAALRALDDLLQRGLVRETDTPRRFRFRHPIVRRAVYESATAAWRLGAHRRCAELLAAGGAAATARAHHVERSAAVGDRQAVAVLREAGDLSLHRAPGSAATWYAAALRLLPDAAPADERVELLLASASALSATGRLKEGHAAMLDAIASAPAEGRALTLRLVASCARLEHLMGRHREARARLEAALAATDDDSTPERVALMLELVVDALYRFETDDAAAWATRALAVVAPEDAALRAEALALRSTAASLGGSASGGADRDEAAAIVDELSDETLAERLDALAYVAMADFYLDRFAEAARHARRARVIVRFARRGDLEAAVLPMLGSSLAALGRTAEATEVFDEAVEGARLVDNPHTLALALNNQSFGALVAGDLDRAIACAEECRRVAPASDVSQPSFASAVSLAHALCEAGEPARAAKLLVEAVGPEAEVSRGSWRARTLELLTRCALDLGDRAEAARAAAVATAYAEQARLPMALAMAARARARLALDSGDAAAAAREALDAAAMLEGTGNLYDAARTRVLAGRALAAAGDTDEAAAELESAAAALAAFGSARYRAEAERELRKLGRRVRRPSAPAKRDGTPLELLTGRELQLAQLVVERKTNTQIASDLFLSQKTVESHLRNIFRKLGVTNRVELARAVEQHTGDSR